MKKTIKVKKRENYCNFMKMNFKIIILISVSFALMGTEHAFAQTTFTINMPTGAASPQAPFFWQVEDTGNTDGKVTINVNDFVEWENADTAVHTVVSGVSPEIGGNGPDGVFDSNIMNPGTSFKFQFTKTGVYDYYCTLHPWMVGAITVKSALKVLPNVGEDVGDGATIFDVEYDYNRLVVDATVDVKEKAITFTLAGKAQNDDNTLTLYLPKGLINNPSVIWVDGNPVTNFEVTSEKGMNVVKIPVTKTTEQVTILGSSVVPEFGPLTAIILATAMATIIFVTSKSKIIPKIQ